MYLKKETAKVNLQKGTTNNNIALTLKEKVTIDPVNFLFEFQNDQTKVKYYCICQDISVIGTQRDRSNLFDITEGVDDPLNSSIILGNTGRYHVTVWEQSSSSNLDPDLATSIVHRGMCNLYDTESSQYKTHSITITYKVHEPTL